MYWGIFMKTLNELINNYTCHLRQGEIQVAYKGILEFIGKLRADFILIGGTIALLTNIISNIKKTITL